MNASLQLARHGVSLATLSPDRALWRHDLEWFDQQIKDLSQ